MQQKFNEYIVATKKLDILEDGTDMINQFRALTQSDITNSNDANKLQKYLIEQLRETTISKLEAKKNTTANLWIMIIFYMTYSSSMNKFLDQHIDKITSFMDLIQQWLLLPSTQNHGVIYFTNFICRYCAYYDRITNNTPNAINMVNDRIHAIFIILIQNNINLGIELQAAYEEFYRLSGMTKPVLPQQPS